MNLLDDVLEEEGFRDKPYQDHLGNWTIGHGITNLTEDESKVVVQMKLDKLMVKFTENVDVFSVLHPTARKIVVHMAYQLGFNGVLRFKKMWEALKRKDYILASQEMLNSQWARQTPARAVRLAEEMKNIA